MKAKAFSSTTLSVFDQDVTRSPDLALSRQLWYPVWKLALCRSSSRVLDMRYMVMDLM